MIIFNTGIDVEIAAPLAFITASVVNYLLSISILFRSKVKWNSTVEILVYALVVITVGTFDLYFTKFMLNGGFSPLLSKLLATGLGFVLNFAGRKYLVFPEKKAGPWKPTAGEIKSTIEPLKPEPQQQGVTDE